MYFFKKKKPNVSNGTSTNSTTELNQKQNLQSNIEFTQKLNYKSLFEHHTDLIFTLNESGDILEVNQKIEMLGYSPKEVSGSFNKYVKTSELKKNLDKFKLVLEGYPQNYNSELIHKNGHEIKVNITSVPMVIDEKIIGLFGIIKDISELKEKEHALFKVQNSLELAQKMVKIGNWDIDMITGKSYWSKHLYKILGVKMNDEDSPPSFESFIEIIHPIDRLRVTDAIRKAQLDKKNYELEYRVIRYDGQIRYIYEKVQLFFDERNQLIRKIGVCQDITRKHLAEEELRKNEEQLRAIYDNLDAGIWSLNIESNQFHFLSTAIENISGYELKDLYRNSLSWENIIHPDDRSEYLLLQKQLLVGKSLHHQYRILHKNGDIRWVQDHTIPILNHEGKVAQLYGMVSDITPQKEFEEKMTYLAYHDFLTHLPNARSFEQRLSTIAEEFNRTGERFAVLSIDLDRVKQINDSLGHAIGDQLIKSMSKRMLSLLSDQHFLARISGDEYAILFTNYESPEVLAHFAKSLLNKINQPFKIDSYELFLTASIGISIFPNDSNDFKKVLTNAHAALNRAKELGKDNYQFYSPTHDILAYKAFLLEKDLRHALTSNQFELYYQPRIDLKSKKIISAEALIRWKHPDWGLVSPGEFISLAEESGFIIEIGKWVILHVCEQIKKWQQESKPVVPISINLSSKSLQKYNWKTSLSHILNQTNVDPTLLEFEITENTILHKEEVIEKAIGYIKDLGVKLSLDDFGTGYASITNLKHYQFDFIKIDRSFIQNITENSQDGLIVKSMIRLSHDLKMKVVAEGVETLEQLKLLQSYGCDEVQGYLFSKPVELEKFEKLLTSMIILPETPRCSKEMKERRKSHRIELPFPISSDMTIAQIKGQPLSLGVSEIIIDNIGRGGIHFLSHIKLPVHSEVILQITIELFDKKIQLQGHVVWQNEMKDQVFEYGLKYTMIDENQLLPLLEQLKKELHKTPKFQSHHLITEDKIQYIEKLRINN